VTDAGPRAAITGFNAVAPRPQGRARLAVAAKVA